MRNIVIISIVELGVERGKEVWWDYCWNYWWCLMLFCFLNVMCEVVMIYDYIWWDFWYCYEMMMKCRVGVRMTNWGLSLTCSYDWALQQKKEVNKNQRKKSKASQNISKHIKTHQQPTQTRRIVGWSHLYALEIWMWIRRNPPEARPSDAWMPRQAEDTQSCRTSRDFDLVYMV